MIKSYFTKYKKSFYNEIVFRFAFVQLVGLIIFTLVFLMLLRVENQLRNMNESFEQIRDGFMNQKMNGREFLASEVHNEKFFQSGKSLYLDKVRQSHFEIMRNQEILFDQVSIDFQKEIIEFRKIEDDYYQTLNKIWEIFFKLGYKDWGLEGSWRSSIHELESYINKLEGKNKDVYLIQYLQLRRHEKDFLARQEDQYIDRINKVIYQLKDNMSQDRRIGHRELTLLDNYSNSMSLYFKLLNDRKLLQIQALEIENKSNELVTKFEIKFDEKIRDLRSYLWLFLMTLSVFLFGVLSVLMARQAKSLLQPIEILKNMFSRVSRGDLEHNLELSRVDEFKQLQDEFNIMIENLRVAKNQFQLATIGAVSADIAHDISNPLTIIVFHVDRLIKSYQDLQFQFQREDFLKTMDKVKKSVNRVEKIVASIKTLARKSSPTDFQKINVFQLIEESYFFVELKVKQKGVTFQLESLDKNLHTNGNPTQLSQVLVNLISNAVDAIENLDEKWIHVQVKDLNQTIEISITDSGKGIPDKIRQTLFKVGLTTKEQGKGTGLGLMMAKQIIETHLGEIYVENFHHTRFVIHLPHFIAGEKTGSDNKAA